jgi:DNA-binding MarR family transcriptional regulator
MKSKIILVDLIEHLSAYEIECDKLGLEMSTHNFINYVSTKSTDNSSKIDAISGGVDDWRPESMPENKAVTDISILVVLLFRYAKGYMRKALKNSNIKTADEFSFLITLLTYKSLTKIELINLQIMEKTSGIEIINRLISSGFIEQRKDDTDKRSMRISITQKGRFEVISILPQMQTVSQIVVGNLNEDEKKQLNYLLTKLDHFHNNIFQNKRDCELNEILS